MRLDLYASNATLLLLEMGRVVIVKELLVEVETNSYKRETYIERDQVRYREKYIKRT